MSFYERVIDCQIRMRNAKTKEERDQADRELAKLQQYERERMKIVK